MFTPKRKCAQWIAFGIVVILLAGCSAPAAAPPPPTAPRPTTLPAATGATTSPAASAPATASTAAVAPAVPTGDLRIGVSDLGADAVDPMLMSSTGAPFIPLIYDFLVGSTPDGSLSKETGLATDWESSADGLKWTFHLRKGVKFQNGDDLTAEDAKFSLERAMGPKARLGYVATTRSVIAGVEAPDPYTVVVNLKFAYGVLPYFLSQLMGSHEGAVVPKKYATQIGDDQFAAKPIGSGPYKVISHTPGNQIKLEAISTPHWRVGVPKYKTVSFNMITEPTTRVASLKRGENDIIVVPVEMLKDVSGFNVAEKKEAYGLGLYLTQQWDDVPYKDVRVRQALAEAIDRKAINDTLLGGLGTMNYEGSLGVTHALGYPNLAPIPYSPEHAKQLLKDAGFAQGFDINYYIIPRSGGYNVNKIGEMIVEYWRAIGVRSNVVRTDYATLKPLWQGKKLPNTAWLNAGNNMPLQDPNISACFAIKGSATTVQDPKLDSLITENQRAKTLDDYAKAQGAVLQYMRDNYIQIGILTAGEYYATVPAVKGWNPGLVSNFINLDAVISTKK